MKRNVLIGLLSIGFLNAGAQDETVAPPPPPPPPEIVKHIADADPPTDKEFLKRNKSVRSVHWNFENDIIITLKTGKEERYHLKDKKQVEAAESKYGMLPVAPPPPPLPPPPPPPAPPKKTIAVS